MLVVGVLAAGCGYKAGYIARDDIGRVAVPIFGNRTYYRNIEIDLTRAVISEIEKTTPYEISTARQADAVLEAEITDYRTQVLHEDKHDMVQEMQVVVAIRGTLKRTGSGEVLWEGKIRARETYAPGAGETEMSARGGLWRRVGRLLVERSFDRDW